MTLIAHALRWIDGELRRLDIPYQAVGGLAAEAWGSRRPLVDLDFYVPERTLPRLADALRAAVVSGPQRVAGDLWDVRVLELSVESATIELGGAESACYRDRTDGTWRTADVGFERSVRRVVRDVTIPVMPREELIRYKAALGRDVDLVDLHYLDRRDDAVDTRLAVYGSLAPGEVNAEQLAGLGGSWERGAVRGVLHPQGWGMSYGFPALAWHPDADSIPVLLFTSAGLPAHWPRLDAFEGPGYVRAVIPVALDAGGKVLANVYLGRAP